MADDKGGTIESLNIKIGVNADNVLTTLSALTPIFMFKLSIVPPLSSAIFQFPVNAFNFVV